MVVASLAFTAAWYLLSTAATVFASSCGEAFDLVSVASAKTTIIKNSFTKIRMFRFCHSIYRLNPDRGLSREILV
jgi:hypothetical protein